MNNNNLKPPQDYVPAMVKLLEYRKDLGIPVIYKKYRIESRTNRHTTPGGYSWGWYEIFPLGIIIGYWNNETGRDDLKHVDISSWNYQAEILEFNI